MSKIQFLNESKKKIQQFQAINLIYIFFFCGFLIDLFPTTSSFKDYKLDHPKEILHASMCCETSAQAASPEGANATPTIVHEKLSRDAYAEIRCDDNAAQTHLLRCLESQRNDERALRTTLFDCDTETAKIE